MTVWLQNNVGWFAVSMSMASYVFGACQVALHCQAFEDTVSMAEHVKMSLYDTCSDWRSSGRVLQCKLVLLGYQKY